MKVPIEVEDEKNEAVEPDEVGEAEVAESQAADAPSAESEAGAEDSAGPEGLDPEEVAAATTANARRMFGRPQMPSGSPAREDAPSGHGKKPNDTRP